MRYFRPKSLGWWSGIAMIVTGLLPIINDPVLIGQVIGIISGGVDESAEVATRSALLILNGLGLIGVRDKLERMHG